MKDTKSLRIIIYILIFVNTFGVIASALAGNLINTPIFKNSNNIKIVVYILVISNTVILDFIFYIGLKILQSIDRKEIFISLNTKRLRRISLGSCFLSFLNISINVLCKADSIMNLEIMAFITVAVFTQVLSYIFNEGCKLKESESRLRQENKLTI